MSHLSQPNANSESEVIANFDSPPVVETALSAQMSGVNWSTVRFGQLYERIKDRYPTFCQLHEVPPIIETFPLVPSAPSFNFSDRPTAGRGMFAAEDNSHLIQIQGNRFGFNWKRASDESPYPRFGTNLEKFQEEFELFLGFCSDLEIGVPVPTFCEVVYVNRIEPKEGESMGALFDAVFKGVQVSDDFEPELITLNRTFVLGGQEGRLYAEAGVVSVPSPFVTFKLTSRLRVSDEDLVGQLQRAHDWLIEGFLKLTNDSCRKERWGQR